MASLLPSLSFAPHNPPSACNKRFGRFCKGEIKEIWATTAAIAKLYGRKDHTITEHISDIYKEHELEQQATTRKFRVVRLEGDRKVNRDMV